jgi:Putative peptidoglycan binding domain
VAGYHEVRQGEHLARLAHEYGFSDYHSIWNHPNNADLKQTRQSPNILFPGDSLFIPDRQLREESCSTDQRHVFKTKKGVLKLRLTLEDLYEEPIADAQCLLLLGSDTRHVTTDGDGRIEQDIPWDAHDAILMIQDPQTAFDNTNIAIKIGDLDPVDKVSGQTARLNNLGYFAGNVNQPDDTTFKSAVEEFQCDHAVTVNGICDPTTQSKLKQVHGC